ncbi:MAG: hypothetical protein PHY23_00495 [Oscillospiraceae bacterium]|nr:hypothetical protein [Oscillospiraceae bacterium]
MWYDGAFPLIGHAGGAPDADDPPDVFEDEETAFGFHLRYEQEKGSLRIEVSANLPWLLEPPIEITRYINKARLPERDNPKEG